MPKPIADPEIEARGQIRLLVAGIQEIERIRAKTPPGAMDAGCVDEKLAEARAGLQIAGGELGHVRESTAPEAGGDRDYALHRLHLLVERAAGLTRAARVCATEELSTVDTTKVEVEISPSVPRGDWTSPPSIFELPQRPPQQ
ncbi:MAG TPA: hypothetical protein VGP64_14735 [Polyangia bacterium]|jgi:hypothetical protein